MQELVVIYEMMVFKRLIKESAGLAFYKRSRREAAVYNPASSVVYRDPLDLPLVWLRILGFGLCIKIHNPVNQKTERRSNY